MMSALVLTPLGMLICLGSQREIGGATMGGVSEKMMFYKKTTRGLEVLVNIIQFPSTHF